MPVQVHFDFEKVTNTVTYVVYDDASKDAVIIDSVLDYEPVQASISYDHFDTVCASVERLGVNVKMILETHAHADHLSASQPLKAKYGAPVAIGAEITKVQAAFAEVLDMPSAFKTDGSQFDLLLKDGEEVSAGSLTFKVLYTPGHTPACACYLFGDIIFTGDSLFMPDFGSGRCDFPKGSAEDLHHSITQVLYQLPDATRVFVGHDYQPGGRELKVETTIGDSKANNVHVKADTDRDTFVQWRKERDATLNNPRLLFPSVQANIAAGQLQTGAAGQPLVKMPVSGLKKVE